MVGLSPRWVLRVTLSAAALAAVTTVAMLATPTNPTTVALSYLVLVLLVATEWGIVESTILAMLATLSFNLFFLPPVGVLTIADPDNVVSFLAFTLTAVVVSQLSGRARARQLDAVARQRDLERLYTLSRNLLLTDAGRDAPAGIARQIADVFELDTVALYDAHAGVVARAGLRDLPEVETMLRDVARQAITIVDPAGVVVTAIRLGGAPIGSLAVPDRTLTDTVLQAVVNLAAIGLERARAHEAAATADAVRRSSELQAAVLDGLAHEFKTPLTAIRAAVGGLEQSDQPPEPRELLSIIDEESAHLQGLVADAVHMFRVEAGDIHLHRDRHPLRDLVDRAVEGIGARAGGRAIANAVPPDLQVDADAELLGLALRQLLDNALKYSLPATPIEVAATGGAEVDIVVRNAGPEIPEHERSRIFERYYRGSLARQVAGTGMGLAIVRRIARAHGGDASVAHRDGTTELHVLLPRGGERG